jgi:hypothetical protein
MSKFFGYVLARASERSTVAGLAGAAVAAYGAFGGHANPDAVSQVVNLVVMGAGMAAAVVPGGK